MTETVALLFGLFMLFGWPALTFWFGRYVERNGWPLVIRWRGFGHHRDADDDLAG